MDGVIFEKYQIVSRLGKGAYGEVYEGKVLKQKIKIESKTLNPSKIYEYIMNYEKGL